MSFKKVNEHVKAALDRLEIKDANPFQSAILPKIKGGANVYGIGPKGCGKTTAFIIATVQKLKGEAFEDAPRAVIIVKNKEAAIELEESFKLFIRRTDLRIFSAFEEQHINNQIDSIYPGVDIVIATPKRLSKLYFLNGINLSQLQLFIIEDAEFLQNVNNNTELNRLSDSIGKCQYLIFGTKMETKMKKFEESFMMNAQLIRG